MPADQTYRRLTVAVPVAVLAVGVLLDGWVIYRHFFTEPPPGVLPHPISRSNPVVVALLGAVASIGLASFAWGLFDVIRWTARGDSAT